MVGECLLGQARGDAQLAGMLAGHGGHPAFFFQKSPPDTDRGWEGACYPRADFSVDMRHDPERKAAGSLEANIWCTAESACSPEDIARRLVELIDGTFYSAPGEAAACAAWARTDSFAAAAPGGGADTAPEAAGATVLFDLMEFPPQETASPDPAQGLNRWTKARFPGMAVVAFDALPPVWRPTDERPAIYWRFAGASLDARRSTYAVDWLAGRFAAHVAAGSVAGRNGWAKAVMEALLADGEAALADGSPLFVAQAEIRHGADPLREGQIAATGMYGALRRRGGEAAGAPLARAVFTGAAVQL